MKVDWFKLAASVAVCQLAGAIGSIATVPAIGSWYAFIAKPAFNPPNWVFAPVWLLLFTLMGVALYLVWIKGVGTKSVKNSLYLFALQFALNVLWSFLFFGLHQPFYALLEIVVLWLAILATAVAFHRVSKPAGLLLVPYLAWVSFAVFLNYSVWLLNP